MSSSLAQSEYVVMLRQLLEGGMTRESRPKVSRLPPLTAREFYVHGVKKTHGTEDLLHGPPAVL